MLSWTSFACSFVYDFRYFKLGMAWEISILKPDVEKGLGSIKRNFWEMFCALCASGEIFLFLFFVCVCVVDEKSIIFTAAPDNLRYCYKLLSIISWAYFHLLPSKWKVWDLNSFSLVINNFTYDVYDGGFIFIRWTLNIVDGRYARGERTILRSLRFLLSTLGPQLVIVYLEGV